MPPALPPLAGWKSYEPKTDVAVDGAATITGTKTVEWLMRPERAGKTDRAVAGAGDLRSGGQALRDGPQPADRNRRHRRGGVERGAGRRRGRRPPAGLENVVGGTIRPIHARGGLGGESGAAFLRSAGFSATVVTPPLALAALRLFGRVARAARARHAPDAAAAPADDGRRRLRAAEAHRAAGRAGDFYIEIDRVLREVLSERLGSELGGLRLDELGALLRARGLPPTRRPAWSTRSRPATRRASRPGGAAGDPAALTAMLERAGELIDAIERAPLGEEARA